jgi:hypothetical protein
MSSPRLARATATFNPVTGVLWVEYPDGRTARLCPDIRTHRQAGGVLCALGAVRYSDWGLTATGSPLRTARIEVRDDLTDRF